LEFHILGQKKYEIQSRRSTRTIKTQNKKLPQRIVLEEIMKNKII
jgi:hypothetical protein